MDHFIIFKGGFLGEDGFEKFPQFWDIPLFVSQIIDEMTQSILGFYLEKLIKRTPDGNNSQILIQNQKGFTDCINDTHGEFLGFGYFCIPEHRVSQK